MKRLLKVYGLIMAVLLTALAGAGTVFASDDDNSLSDIGITTPGAVIEPDFSYDVWEYQVRVPEGTTKLELDPVPSSANASIASITGAELSEDGTSTVYVTVESGSGLQFSYTLYVTADGEPAPEEPETETEIDTAAQQAPRTEPETQAETEDDRYVKVDKNTIQEAEDTITTLKGDITRYRDTVSLYTKIMYGLIALSVIMLFLVINLILKKRDLKRELNEYRSLGYTREQASSVRSNHGNAQYAQAAQTPYRQQPPVRQAPEPGQLDVMPQTSGRKRKLPSYEEAPYEGASGNVQQVEPVADRQTAKAAAKAQKQAEKAAAQAAKASQREAAQAERQAAKAAKAAEQQAASRAAAPAQNVPSGPAPSAQETAAQADAARNGEVEINMIDL